MSKQDYELIAGVIDGERGPHRGYSLAEEAAANETLDRVAYRLALRFDESNPRFDAARFLDACGVVTPPNQG